PPAIYRLDAKLGGSAALDLSQQNMPWARHNLLGSGRPEPEETADERYDDPVPTRRCARSRDGAGARLHRHQIAALFDGRGRHEPGAERRRADEGQPERAGADG